MRRPRLAVCIPTWNGSRTLAHTLSSVLCQRGVDLRVIIVDDASTDATLEIASSTGDARVAVHACTDHLGLGGNWNRALRLADGDFIAFVGQDDELAPDWATQLTAALEQHPDADLAFGRRSFAFDDEPTRLAVSRFFESEYPRLLDGFYSRIGSVIPTSTMVDEAFRHKFEINLIGEPSFALIRASSPAVASGFDTAMVQMIDWEFYTRIFVGSPIAYCPGVVGVYHLHARSASLANVSLATHYRDYDYLLGCVLARFDALLGPERRRVLEERRTEVGRLRAELTMVSRGGAAGANP